MAYSFLDVADSREGTRLDLHGDFFHRDHWYKIGNLIDWPYDAASEVLPHIRVGDGQKYYNRLCFMLPLAARRMDGPGPNKIKTADFIEKVILLVNHLDTNDTRSYAFHAMIRVACSVFRPEARIFLKTPTFRVEAVNRALLQTIKDRIRQEAERLQREKSTRHSSMLYWNFAAANRKLWSAWKEDCRSGSTDGMERKCWHIQNQPLVDYIWRRAYGEIRTKVMLIVGRTLPPELAEKVFGFAMESEEVPMDSDFYLRASEDVPESEHNLDRGSMVESGMSPYGWKYCGVARKADLAESTVVGTLSASSL